MARTEVARALAKDFLILKIDTDRTLGGQKMLDSYRGDQRGGIPWFIFLDARGARLADSNGPNGNIGCPYTEEEVAQFGKILEGVTRNMAAGDIAVVLQTLAAQRKKN